MHHSEQSLIVCHSLPSIWQNAFGLAKQDLMEIEGSRNYSCHSCSLVGSLKEIDGRMSGDCLRTLFRGLVSIYSLRFQSGYWLTWVMVG